MLQLEVRPLLSAFECAPIPMVAHDLSGMITDWNHAAEQLLGWRTGEMLGRRFEFEGEVRAPASHKAEQQNPDSLRPARLRHKDGQMLDLHAWELSLSDENHQRQGTISVLLDVTQRVRSEQRLAAQNRVLEIISEEGSPKDEADRILEAICEELGWEYGGFWRVKAGGLVRRALWLQPGIRSRDCPGDVPGCTPGPQIVFDVCEDRLPTERNVEQELSCCQCANHCRLQMRTAMAVPILLSGKLWGALEFSTSELRKNDRETLACLNSIGSQIGNWVERNAAQQRLRDKEKLYRTIFDSAGIGITGAGPDGCLTRMNAAYLEMLGYTEAELRNRPFREITHPDDVQLELPLLDELIRGERSQYSIEKRYIKKDGELLWVRLIVSATTEEPKFFVAMVENIEEQRRAQELLRLSEERFRLMVEGSEQVFFFEFDAGHRVSYVSPSIRDVLGYESAEVIGHRFDELFTGDASDWEVMARADKSLAEGSREPVHLTTLRHKQGHPVVLEITEAPAKSGDGALIMQGFARDVTLQKMNEERLNLSDKILRAVDSICLVANSRGQIIYVNPFTSKVLGYAAEQLLGYGWWHHTAASEETSLESCNRMAAQARGESPVEPEAHEQLLRDLDGNEHWILWSDARGPGDVLIGTGQEITNRKLAEFALADRTRQMDALIANMPLAILLMDRHQKATSCNPEFERIFQYSNEEIAGRYFGGTIVPPEALDEAIDIQNKVLNGELAHLTVTRLRKDGVGVLVELQAVPLRVNGEIIGSYGLYRDVTEPARSEKALRESEERLELFFSQSLVGAFFMMLDEPVVLDESFDQEQVSAYIAKHLRITKVNQALAEQYHTTQENMLGLTLEMAYSRSHTYDDDFVFRVLREGRVAIELEDRTFDDAPLWITADYVTMRDSSNRMIGVFGMQRDITENKKLEQQFQQSQKMEAVGRLAGGVAHDFNNMLTVIRGYSELMLRKLPASDPLQRHANAILTAADRSASITQQLLAFSRRQVLQLQLLSLNTIVGDMSKLLRRLIGEDVELRVLLASDLGKVKADPGQLGQILLNLAVNARDAMPGGGSLTIETSNVELDEAYATTHLNVQPGRFVMMGVADTGCGMSAATRAQIFEPYFTTKGQGKGTGLGLATVYGIVKQSGGAIYVYSEPNEGTTFRIYLPRMDAATAGESSHEQELEANGRVLLLIEDDDSARQVVREYLEGRGYCVLSAESGEEAIRLCEATEKPVEVVLSDVVLPGINGQDLAGYFSSKFPGVRMLYMSGYSQSNLISRRILGVECPFLQKPFRMQELIEQLHHLFRGTNVAQKQKFLVM